MEFSDKVVQTAIYRVLKEELQSSFYEHTYASLSNRGMNDLRRIYTLWYKGKCT